MPMRLDPLRNAIVYDSLEEAVEDMMATARMQAQTLKMLARSPGGLERLDPELRLLITRAANITEQHARQELEKTVESDGSVVFQFSPEAWAYLMRSGTE